MSPEDMETVLKFYMNNLPEDKLAELDAMLNGDAEQVAQDAAMKPQDRQAWLALDSGRRHAVRKAKRDAGRARQAADAAYEARYPHANRLY